ncbi:MAG: Maf family protein [Terriglobales bacterium]
MLVLASASPRRQELLRNAGIEFVVHPANVPEIPQDGELPRAFAERMAREKALAVFAQRPNEPVLGADTVVVVDGEILGKPRDTADAARMLRLLSGRRHEVITGVCIAGRLPLGLKPAANKGLVGTAQAVPFHGRSDGLSLVVRAETTLVTMEKLSEDEISSYVASGEPMDKAGGYAIQGMVSRWISRIEGDYFNVVGLPVALVWRMLEEAQGEK